MDTSTTTVILGYNELSYLLLAVTLCVVQMLIAATLAFQQVGLPKLVGNREDMPELTGMAGRAQRAHRNMVENLVLFATLVLIAVVAGRTNEGTLLGAQLFVGARTAYALVYLVGIAWLRTIVWAASMAGLVMIFAALA